MAIFFENISTHDQNISFVDEMPDMELEELMRLNPQVPPFCSATCKEYKCSLKPGHSGPHFAVNHSDGTIGFAQWANLDEKHAKKPVLK